MMDLSLQTALELRCTEQTQRTKQQNKFLVAHALKAAKSPFYQRMFAECGLPPQELNLDNLQSLPFTNRQDLDNFPTDFLAVNNDAVVDLALTSGTTGRPVTVSYTRQDLKRLAFNEMLGFYGAGVRKEDTFLLCVTLDRCFVAGLAYYSGLVALGAGAIRSGPGQMARQWELIKQLHPTGIVGVPSFLLKLGQWAGENGIDPHKSGIKKLVTIGEPVRKYNHNLTPLGQDLFDTWQADIYSSYGATEFETAFSECSNAGGGHIHPELMIAEIIDDNGNPLADGEPGEVVVTPLGVEGFPLLRFRTGDIARLHHPPCACGWQTPRLGAIEGRLAQRLKVKGTTLYPEAIFQTLQEIRAVHTAYIEVRSTYDLSDEIKIVASTDDNSVDPDFIAKTLQARLRVRPEVLIKPRAEVLATMTKAGGRKPKNFFDLRKETII